MVTIGYSIYLSVEKLIYGTSKVGIFTKIYLFFSGGTAFSSIQWFWSIVVGSTYNDIVLKGKTFNIVNLNAVIEKRNLYLKTYETEMQSNSKGISIESLNAEALENYGNIKKLPDEYICRFTPEELILKAKQQAADSIAKLQPVKPTKIDLSFIDSIVQFCYDHPIIVTTSVSAVLVGIYFLRPNSELAITNLFQNSLSTTSILSKAADINGQNAENLKLVSQIARETADVIRQDHRLLSLVQDVIQTQGLTVDLSSLTRNITELTLAQANNASRIDRLQGQVDLLNNSVTTLADVIRNLTVNNNRQQNIGG